jgi:hypothetical protein
MRMSDLGVVDRREGGKQVICLVIEKTLVNILPSL